MAENILHFNGIRLRVTGTGNLLSTLYGFDKIDSKVIAPLVMSLTNSREPTRLTNFVSQRALVRLETTETDEIMRVNRLILFVKPLYTSFPG